jgi:hypothetical protein
MDPNAYSLHIQGRLQTLVTFQKVMVLKNRRRWKFDSYQSGQRAVTKLVTAILEGVEDKTDVIVGWGNGSFGPTSKGHAAAPNVALRRSLAPFFPIVLINEYKTSQMTCCCHTVGIGLRTDQYKQTNKRTTVLQCPTCRSILSRDVNAASNIYQVFKYQTEERTSTTPTYLQRNSKEIGAPTIDA